MYRLTIIVGRLYKSAPPTNYLFKVPLVGRFVPLVGGIGRPVESPLDSHSFNVRIVESVFLLQRIWRLMKDSFMRKDLKKYI